MDDQSKRTPTPVSGELLDLACLCITGAAVAVGVVLALWGVGMIP